MCHLKTVSGPRLLKVDAIVEGKEVKDDDRDKEDAQPPASQFVAQAQVKDDGAESQQDHQQDRTLQEAIDLSGLCLGQVLRTPQR